MDGNKDEAVKCLRIGKEALQSGDRARALKFLSKARRLDPSLPVDALLSTAASADADADADANADPSPPPPPPPDTSRPTSPPSSGTASAAKARVRARARAGAGAGASSSDDASSRSYTEEQAAIVRQIRIQKDYYQILGVEKGCSVEDVRRAYRKLSLKVHPDKNQAPGAEEAFKAVSKAFQCLSDDESRKRYDLIGSEEPALRRAPARHGSHGFNGFYEADFDADEIFRNFFFGGMAPAAATPFGTFHFRTGGAGGGMGARGMHGGGAAGSAAASNSKLLMLIQILPIILFLLLNFLPSSDPLYSLSRTYSHEHKLQTPHGVPYFVKSGPKFEEEYPYDSPKRAALEQGIEREYVGILRQNCRAELQRRQWGWDEEMVYCNRLRKFESAAA
uniref:J domain-containing protein n=1 Tax=Ananas comosus var. bracteatus TaxID=296719 RepID=A0A6V7NZ26_ANACO|nr:unnamed protein product [Ananas comosus var. bracteatus]